MSENNQNGNVNTSQFKQIATWAFRIVIGVTVIWLLLVFLEVSAIQWTYVTISDWLSQNLNLGDEISTGLAVILTAAALPFLSLVTSFLFLGKHQIDVALWAIGAACVAIVLQLAFGQDVFFLEDGTPMRCYAMTPDGIKVTRRKPTMDCPLDKTYQIQMIPMTRQIAPSVLAAKRGVAPVRIDLKSFDGNYVDGANGRTLVWYYHNKDGTYDLFYGAGFHPSTGQMLLPADSQVMKAVVVSKAALAAIAPPVEAQTDVHNPKEQWVKFDPRKYTLTEVNGVGDPFEITISGSEWVQLPSIPVGVLATIYCEGGEMLMWEGTDPSNGWVQDCGTTVAKKFNGQVHVAVAPKDNGTVNASMKFKY